MARDRSGLLSDQLGMLYNLGRVEEWSDGQLLGRFLAREDPAESEAAFAALVERHGAMVLRVCRGILGDSHDAHDAFQATFLLLVRKASSIRNRESVGEWLFRIARRVAVRARVVAVRRRQRLEVVMVERRNSPAETGAIAPDAGPDQESLIAEVDRLPERYRAAVVLHYFEGLSTEATARRLGCARGTVLSRLSRARERLRSRLERRGVSLEAVWPIGAAADRLARTGTVPSLLARNTIRAAASTALGGAAIEGAVPAAVAALARQVARTLVVSRVRTAACLIILAASVVSIGLAASRGPADEPSRPASGAGVTDPPRGTPAKGQEPQPGKAREDSLVFRGQVLDPDGQPVAGAPIIVTGPNNQKPPDRLATSGPDGRFEATVPVAAIDEAERDDLPTFLAAFAPGSGPGRVKIDRQAAAKPVAIRLVRDDVPIEGRILGLEGRGVPDARISVYAIADLPDGFLAKLRSDAGQANPSHLWDDVMGRQLMLNKAGPIAAVRTGPDGRFRMNGLGRDRVVGLTVEGESIVETMIHVVTTADPAYKPLPISGDDWETFKLLGPHFELAAPPGRTVEGVVRDAETGRPIPGAKVGARWTMGGTTSDGQGRFRLAGMPKAEGNILYVGVEDQPYVKVEKTVGDAKGLGPVRFDVELRRGVWVTGRVVDKSSGRPVKAMARYLALRDNPRIKDYTGAVVFRGTGWYDPEYRTDADGRFRAVALPGGGLLVARSLEPGYLIARPLAPKARGNVMDQSQYPQLDYEAIVPINPSEDTVMPDVTLTPGRPQHVRPVGADGRPTERTIHFSESGPWLGDLVPGTEFTLVNPRPGKPEKVLIFSETRELSAFVDIKGDEPDPIRVVLRPSGTVTGRLVDEDARPRPNVRLEVSYSLGPSEQAEQRFSPPLLTGPDGRFRIAGLVPGLTYTVAVIRKGADYEHRYEGNLHSEGWTLKPGEVSAWGDVRPLE
jgi:RNA polymerase sigma factor (sigma-70 family)